MKDFLTTLGNMRFPIIILALFLLFIPFAESNGSSQDVKLDKDDVGVGNKKYEDAGNKVVTTLISGDAEAFSNAINKKTLLDRTFEGISQDIKVIRKARSSLSSALDRVGDIITRNLGEHSQLTFIRSRFMNGEHRALVRIDMGERGLNYLDFILGEDSSGVIKIIDWHDYAQGQLYTDSLRQVLVILLPQDRTLIEKLLVMPGVDRKTVKSFTELARLSRESRFAQWMDKYNDSPDRLKYSRIMLITRVLIASALGVEDQHRLALKDLNKYIGDDPTLSLLLIDHYFYEGDFEAAHEALNRLHNYPGGDAAIDFLHSNVYFTEKNYPESIKHSQIAIKQDPFFEYSYWTLLNASIYEKKYQIAVNTLKHLESEFGYKFDPKEMANQEGYEKFVKSSTFTRWMRDNEIR